MTDSSIASSTSIPDSSPSSCWQGSSITSRQLSTTLIKSARRRCTPTGSSFKGSEVDNQLHQKDNLKTQNAQELSYCTRVRPGLGIFVGQGSMNTKKHDRKPNGYWDAKSLHGCFAQRRESGHTMAPQSSSRAPSRKKEGNNSIHFNASKESLSIICNLVESANIRCILFAIRNYLYDLQQGNLFARM